MSEKFVQHLNLSDGIDTLISFVDRRLQREIDRDVTGSMQRIFDFFNSVRKPLSLREFFQYWESLSQQEKDEVMLQFI
jgi:hypothetical protein